VPLIRPLLNCLSVIDAGCPQAGRSSRKAFTTKRGTRCREMKALEMNPIVIGDAFRIDCS